MENLLERMTKAQKFVDYKDSFKLELDRIYHSELAEKYEQAINGKLI